MKKFLGLILFLIGCALGIITIVALSKIKIPDTTDHTNMTFFLFGYIGGSLLIGIPAFFCIKYGIRKIKEKDKIY